MAAYVTAQLTFTQVDAYRQYQMQFADVLERFDATLLVADEAPMVSEGDWQSDKVVVIAFSDRTEAMRFVKNADYQRISENRLAGAQTTSILAAGFGDGSLPQIRNAE